MQQFTYQELWNAVKGIPGAYIFVGPNGVYVIGLPAGTTPPPIVQQCVAAGRCRVQYFTQPPRFMR